jgi:endonuclease YncB( thermonuclease family)
MMKKGFATRSFPVFLGLLTFLVGGTGGLCPAFAGDALSGRVTAVKSAEVVILEYGGASGPGRSAGRTAGRYVVRIVGVDAPETGPLAREAKRFVSDLVLGKDVRMRFEQRNKRGEMVSRLFTGDKEVGVELLRAGLARRQPNYDYKYGELSAAESEARTAKRGLWALAPPK